MSVNDTSTGRNDSYKFNLTPKEVPTINTKYCKILTSILPENSISILNDLQKYEPEAMSLELPVVWSVETDWNYDPIEHDLREI